ncbi:MAG: MBL fold metallo-hydrolase RNA specificity domain-containing protein [Gemmatimonadota bacterium]
MEITFAGAAREVTGSCHLVHVNGRTIALDFGLFQGKRSESQEKNRQLPVGADEIDAVVLSHAHIDHAGRLPFLVNRGYSKTIWATPATRDLSAYMLADSAHIQQKDAEFLRKRNREAAEPLYTMRDAARTLELMVTVGYDRPMEILPGVQLTFTEAGHILGSSSVVLECEEGSKHTRLVFSGDVGRAGLPIIRDPAPPLGADAVILESTYGNRDHPTVDDAKARLAEVVTVTAARGGKILIPAFAVGRTQEILYELHELTRRGEIPEIPIFIDSPLAIDATSVFEMHMDSLDRAEDLVKQVEKLFRFELVRYTRDASESKQLNTMRGPLIVIAASGMAESGRIVHHIANGATDPRNTILIVGFQAEHTLGRRIVERQPIIKVFGEEIPLRANVEIINGYSAHGDRRELHEWIRTVRSGKPAPRNVYLVHGEPAAQEAFTAQLTADGFKVSAPARGDRVVV